MTCGQTRGFERPAPLETHPLLLAPRRQVIEHLLVHLFLAKRTVFFLDELQKHVYRDADGGEEDAEGPAVEGQALESARRYLWRNAEGLSSVVYDQNLEENYEGEHAEECPGLTDVLESVELIQYPTGIDEVEYLHEDEGVEDIGKVNRGID